jgi:hypothetical protein
MMTVQRFRPSYDFRQTMRGIYELSGAGIARAGGQRATHSRRHALPLAGKTADVPL